MCARAGNFIRLSNNKKAGGHWVRFGRMASGAPVQRGDIQVSELRYQFGITSAYFLGTLADIKRDDRDHEVEVRGFQSVVKHRHPIFITMKSVPLFLEYYDAYLARLVERGDRAKKVRKNFLGK